MHRDMGLIREILRKIEENEYCSNIPVQIEGCSDDEINYHIKLLIEAGMIEGTVCRTLSPGVPSSIIIGLTWSGHEFLDASRNDTLWEKTKSLIVEKAGTTSFSVLTAVLAEIAKRAIIGH